MDMLDRENKFRRKWIAAKIGFPQKCTFKVILWDLTNAAAGPKAKKFSKQFLTKIRNLYYLHYISKSLFVCLFVRSTFSRKP